MLYFWLIPLVCGGLVVFGLYLRVRARAHKAAAKEARSPLDLAQEMERQEEAAELHQADQQPEKKKAA